MGTCTLVASSIASLRTYLPTSLAKDLGEDGHRGIDRVRHDQIPGIRGHLTHDS